MFPRIWPFYPSIPPLLIRTSRSGLLFGLMLWKGKKREVIYAFFIDELLDHDNLCQEFQCQGHWSSPSGWAKHLSYHTHPWSLAKVTAPILCNQISCLKQQSPLLSTPAISGYRHALTQPHSVPASLPSTALSSSPDSALAFLDPDLIPPLELGTGSLIPGFWLQFTSRTTSLRFPLSALLQFGPCILSSSSPPDLMLC